MTIQELEQTAAALAQIDQQLAGLPVSGRLAQEIAANRAQISETAKFVAANLRQVREQHDEEQQRQALVAELAEVGVAHLASKNVGEKIAGQTRGDLKAEAERRMLGIVRACGSFAANLEQDDLRLLAAARTYVEAMETLNARFEKLNLFKREAQALAEGFGLAMPELPLIVTPVQREAVDEARMMVAHVPVQQTGYLAEQREYDVKTQSYGARSYVELEGTEGAALLKRRA